MNGPENASSGTSLIRAAATPVASMATRLARRAAAIAAAAAESRLRGWRRDAGRWRRARLLWPDLFKEG